MESREIQTRYSTHSDLSIVRKTASALIQGLVSSLGIIETLKFIEYIMKAHLIVRSYHDAFSLLYNPNIKFEVSNWKVETQ